MTRYAHHLAPSGEGSVPGPFRVLRGSEAEPRGRAADALRRSGVHPRVRTPTEPTLVDARLLYDLASVERSLDGPAYDPTMAAAALRARVYELIDIKDALDRVYALSVHDDIDGMFAPGTPLSRYLRGAQRGCVGFAQICTRVAADLRVGKSVDWAVLRRDAARASDWDERALRGDTLSEIHDVAGWFPRLRPALSALIAALGELFSAVDAFHDGLRRYLGVGEGRQGPTAPSERVAR